MPDIPDKSTIPIPPAPSIGERVPRIPRPIDIFPSHMDEHREALGLSTSPLYKRTKEEPEGPDILFKALSNLEDPLAAINQVNAARYIAEMFKLDPEEAYGDLEQLSKYWLGKVTPPVRFIQSVKDAVDNGQGNYSLGKLYLQLRDSGGVNPEIELQIAEIEEGMIDLKETPRPWLKQALLIAAESAPLMIQSYLRGGIAGGLTAAPTGLMYGAVAALITGGLSIPAMTMKMFSVGFITGSMTDLMNVMRGLSYGDLRKQDVPHSIAAPLADISGIVNGAIEMAGEMLIGIVPGVKGIGTRIANKMLMTGYIATIGTRLASQVLGVGISEGIEETLQEVTDVFKEQLAMDMANNRDIVTQIDPLTLDEFINRTTEAFHMGFSAGVIFGVVGVPAGVRADVHQLSTIRDLATTTTDKTSFVNAVIRNEMVLKDSSVSDATWREYLGKVWDKQHVGERTTPLTAAETQEVVQPEGAEPIERPAPEYRTPEGLVYTETKVLRGTKEGQSFVLKAGDPETGARYGYITYETVGEDIYVDEVVNETPQDLKREMILDLAAKHPGSDIEWNPTEEADLELKEALIAENPLGPEKGLQHFAREEVTTETALTRSVFTQRMGELFNLSVQEAGHFGTFADIFAKNQGIAVNEWLNKYIAPEVTTKTPEVQERLAAEQAAAGIAFKVGEEEYVSPTAVDKEEFKGQVRAVFSALETADFHTGIHEFFHAVERLALSKDQIKLFEQALGVLRENWSAEKGGEIEKLADYFEDYLGTGKAPTPELATVFEEIAELLRQLISYIKEQMEREGGPGLSEEFRAAYDALFVKPESGVFQAENKVELAEVPNVQGQVQEDILAPEIAPEEPPETVTRFDMSVIPVVEVSVADIAISTEVPNFKEDATEKGLIEPLAGKAYERLGTAPIVLWERTDGTMEVITGRHRLDLAQRTGEKTIPAQVVRETEGFTAAQSMTFDAESNIRDGQGSVKDYANYFRNSEIKEEEASSRGLLARDKGRKGFAIGKYATNGLYVLYRNDQITETKAAGIASAVPNNEQLQDAGITEAKNLTADELVNYLNILKSRTVEADAVQADLFGKDDSALRDAAALAKEAVKKTGELRTEYNALKGALRLSRGEQAQIVQKYGFTTGDMIAVQARIDELELEIEAWGNWITDPAKHEELRRRMGEGMLFHPDSLVAGGENLAKAPNAEGERIREAIVKAEEWLAQLKKDYEEAGIGVEDRPYSYERYISNLKKVTTKGAKFVSEGAWVWHYLHRSTRPEETNKWRMTAWDKYGPVGHVLAGRTPSGLVDTTKDMGDIDDLISLVYEQSISGSEITETIGDPYSMLFHRDPVDQAELIKKAEKYFGTTFDHREAGYIMPDGTMLDFSGRHYASGYKKGKPLPGQPDYLRAERNVDHRELFGEVGDELGIRAKGGWEAIAEFQQRSGAVRYDASCGVASFLETPTPEQIRAIVRGWKAYGFAYPGNTAFVDLADMAGNIIASAEIDNPTVGKLNAFFKERPGERPMLLHADTEPWILKSAIVIQQKMSGPMPASQIKSMLQNSGVKAEEMKWIGLDDFLTGQKKLTAEEVIRFIAENNVRIEEFVREVKDAGRQRSRERIDELAALGRDRTIEQDQEYERLYVRLQSGTAYYGEPRYEGYNLPGSENYRELLLTLPQRARVMSFEEYYAKYYGKPEDLAPKFREDQRKEAAASYNRALELDTAYKITGPTYKSPHWEETNVVAHVRFDKRVDSEGKQVLFLEEIQSDWHQAGRERGYRKRRVVPDLIIQERERDWMAVDEAGNEWGTVGKRVVANIEEATEYLDRYIREREEDAIRTEAATGKVPLAPFSKTWHELVFRRMLRWAVENGADTLAWTTGEQQADRYKLSEHVSRIEYDADFKRLRAYGKKDKKLVIDNDVLPEDISEWIGKELAIRLLATEVVSPETPTHVLEGDDLAIGGEGMKVFYDKILVNYANKYGKKWGAQVKESHILRDPPDWTKGAIRVFHVHSIPITPEMKKGIAVGQMLFHYQDRWQRELLYGTPIARSIYQKYVDQAKGYESAEAFRTDMVEQYGQLYEGDIAGEEATEFYNEVWEEANREIPEEIPKIPKQIEDPELKDQPEYDYSDKVDAAGAISDEEIAKKMETGELTEKELDSISRSTEQESIEATEKVDTADQEASDALSKLTPAEQLIIELGDKLDAAILDAETALTTSPVEGKPSRKEVAETKIANLYVQFKVALLDNLTFAETLLEEMVWQRAIIFGEEMIGEAAETRVGTSYEKAVQLGRDLQEAIDEKKAKKVAQTAKERHAASRARIYAKKREQMKVFKQKLRDQKANRRALKRYRELRKKLIEDIMREPERNIQYKGYAEAIREIQKGLDPVKRQKRTLYRGEQTRKFLERNPGAAVHMSEKNLEMIYSVSLTDMTLEQLETIDQMIVNLRKLGQLKRSLELGQERRRKEIDKGQAANTVLRGKEPIKPIGGVKPTKRFFKVILPTLKPDRVALWLDGVFEGGKPGIFTHLLQDEVNRTDAEMAKAVRKRMNPFLKQMKQLKLTLDPLDIRILAKGFTWVGDKMDIDGFRYTNGKLPTVNDAMFWYIGLQNEHTAAALLSGVNLPEATMLKGIAMLTEDQRALADVIAQDLEINFPRLRDAFIDIFNMDLPGEDHYVPMHRLEISYETRNQQIAAELTARAGVRKEYIGRGFTKERIDIPDVRQKPIRTDMIGLYIDAVKLQEGFIHQDKMIKDLHSVMESDQVKAAVLQKYGSTFNKWIAKYINDLAQAHAYKSMLGTEKFFRTLRTHAAVSWLAFNILPNLKQLTGVVNYMRDAGPIYLASASAQFVAGKGKSLLKGKFLNNTLVDLVDGKTELLINRLISQAHEDLKNLNKNLYERMVQKIGMVGMASLKVIDATTVYIGWKAVYDKTKAQGGTEAAAIKAADVSTIRTQPSARVQDMAEIYRSGEIFKWFTMFTSELSAIWNRLAFDVPMAIKRGELLNAAADMVAFGLVGLGIAVASGALQGDDWDEKRKKLIMGAFSQYVEALPIIGNDLFNAISGKQFQTGGVKLIPALDYAKYIPQQLARGDYEKALTNIMKGLAMGAGLPVSGPRKAIKAIQSKDMKDLLGWPDK